MNGHGYNCGCAACCDVEAADERRDELIDGLVADYRDDDAKLREAEEWVAGEWVAGLFDGDHYADLTLALHKLHRTEPSALLGSDVLATLYRLAKLHHDAIEAELRRMADDELAEDLRRAA